MIGRILPGLPANGKSAKVVKQLIEEAQGLLSADEQVQNDSSDAEKIVGWFYEKLLEKQCFDDIRELHTPLLLSLKELEDTEAFEAIPVRRIALEAYKKFQLVEQLQRQQQLPMKMEHELLEELPVEEENPREKYQFPEALYEKVKEQKKSVEGGLYLYDYDKTKMVAKQNPKGREMRKKEHLVESGEWTNEESRKQLELSVKGGVLKGVLSGKEKAGIVQYALSPDWKLYGKTQEELNAFKSKASVAHTALLAGGDVRCAGWIVTNNGKITRVGNDSGHYRPVRSQLHQVLAFLRAGGVKLAEISVQDAEDQKAINGADYFKWLDGGMKGPLPNGEKSKNL